MPHAQRTIVIQRPVEVVFAFFTDHANDPRWRPHVKEIRAEGPREVGARIHQVVSGPGGRGIPADIEVTAHEVPRRYAFKVVAGPVRPTGEFRFTPRSDGTEVSLTLAAELGGVKKLALSRTVQRSMDGEVAGLDTAKRLLESD
jgi:uncharacterized membrane protein